MPKPKDPDLQPRLLEAATETFAELGFHATAMTEVGRRAGVTKGGVYFHFAGKEELCYAVLDHWQTRLRAAAFDPLAAGEAARESERAERAAGGEAVTSADRLRTAITDWLAFHFEHPAGARVLRLLPEELRGRWTAQLRQDLRFDLRTRRAVIRGAILRGTQDGSLFAPDPAFAAFVLVSAMDGVVDHWLRAPEDTGSFCAPAVLAGELVGPWSRGVGAVPAEAEEHVSERTLPGRPGWQPFE